MSRSITLAAALALAGGACSESNTTLIAAPGDEDDGGDTDAGPGCSDECATGQTLCTADRSGVRVCGQFDADVCNDYSAAAACDPGAQCVDGSGCPTACVPTCGPAGALRCAPTGDAAVQQCSDANGDGCTEWGAASTCPDGCVNGACCTDACVEGQSQCNNGNLELCERATTQSCSAWVVVEDCADGCNPTPTPSCCLHQCAAGSASCDGNQANRCTEPAVPGACRTLTVESCSQCCNAGVCGPCCNHECASGTQPSCLNATTLRRCQTDASGCRYWSDTNCNSYPGYTVYCDMNASPAACCGIFCEDGELVCGGNGGPTPRIMECQQLSDGSGCWDFVTRTNCAPNQTCMPPDNGCQ